MARKKFKMTAFARFFLVMIILAPLAYIGASYYNGQDGIENIKNLFRGNAKTEVVDTPNEATNTPPSQTMIDAEVAKLQDELKNKTERLDALYQENAALKKQVEDQEKELQEVKDQLAKIKNAVSN